MGIYEIIISLVGGFCAGIINTMAGFGSIITLAIYMDVLGIPGHLANATNRVNVLSSSIIGSSTFYNRGKLSFERNKSIIVMVMLGALLGALLATQLDADGFKKAFKYLLIPILIILLFNPKKFIKPETNKPSSPLWLKSILYFIIGIYAGFIQVGFGIVFLMVAIIFSKLDMITANGLKLAIVGLYTVIILFIFQYNGMIDWKAGLSVAVGQGFGGYFAAHNMVKYENATKWAYYVLVIIVVAVIIKNFELYSFFI